MQGKTNTTKVKPKPRKTGDIGGKRNAGKRCRKEGNSSEGPVC